jgi:hypothetical protein
VLPCLPPTTRSTCSEAHVLRVSLQSEGGLWS